MGSRTAAPRGAEKKTDSKPGIRMIYRDSHIRPIPSKTHRKHSPVTTVTEVRKNPTAGKNLGPSGADFDAHKK